MPVNMESQNTLKRFHFRQVSILAGIILWYSFHQDHEFFLLKARFHYKQVIFLQILLYVKRYAMFSLLAQYLYYYYNFFFRKPSKLQSVSQHIKQSKELPVTEDISNVTLDSDTLVLALDSR